VERILLSFCRKVNIYMNGLIGRPTNFWLTFSPELENQFELECGPRRLRHLQFKGLISLAAYVLFALVDLPILGPRIWLSVLIRFAVVTPAVLAGELFLMWRHQKVTRELTACILSTLMAVSPLAIYRGTPLLVAVGHTALIVISLVSMSITRLRVPYALAQVLALILTDAIFAWLDPSIQFRVEFFFVALVSAAVSFNFLFNRLLELEERRVFLANLRDQAKSDELSLRAAALKAAANSIVITNRNGTIAWTNTAFSASTGYSADEVVGQNPRLLKSGKHDKSFYETLWQTILAGQVWRGEMLNQRKDKSFYPEEMTITPVSLRKNEITHFVAVKQDISERKRKEQALLEAEENYRALFENSVVGIFQHDPDGRPMNINSAFARIHGFDSAEQLLAEISNLPLQLVVDPIQVEGWDQLFDKNEVARGIEVEVYTRNRTKKWVLLNLRVVRDGNGIILRYEGTIEDITERKIAQERLQFLACHDALTGLPGRALLEDRLAKAFARAKRQQDNVALIYLDLDRFQLINDSLGHAIGDYCLQLIADRLSSLIRESETVSRLGGDEFVFVLSDIQNITQAKSVAERIVDAMEEVFIVKGHSLRIGCSVGISAFPDDGLESQTLISNANAAMLRAKDDGRNNVRVFTEDMNAEAMERLRLGNQLQAAIKQRELFLVYQPQVNIITRQITGLEALIRWTHPQMGIVAPGQFIGIAESCGLITTIGKWVLRTACTQARKWQDEGLPALTIAVNVSTIQFRQASFVETVRQVLLETGLEPRYLELEITESLLLSNADNVFSTIRELKEMGVKLAIDDFGTGYSSLSYLRQFRVDKLKIDQSFIRNLPENAEDALITVAIIKLAEGLHLQVIAEGVETEVQLSFLQANGCEEVQGYCFSMPLTADEVPEKLLGRLPVRPSSPSVKPVALA